MWQGIQYGKAKGYTHLDFGLSDWDQEGLVRYKRKFATTDLSIRPSPLDDCLDGAPQDFDVEPERIVFDVV